VAPASAYRWSFWSKPYTGGIQRPPIIVHDARAQ